MRIGVFSTFMSPNATPQMIRDFGHRVEGMGLDSIWMGEHVVLFDKQTFGYPGSKDGRIPVPSGGGLLDVTATFGFLAATTTQLRLGTGVALVPQRQLKTFQGAFAMCLPNDAQRHHVGRFRALAVPDRDQGQEPSTSGVPTVGNG